MEETNNPAICGIQFCIDSDVHSWLNDEVNGAPCFKQNDNFSIDIIDMLFHFTVKSIDLSGKSGVKIEMFVRNNFGIYEAPDAEVLLEKGKKPVINIGSALSECDEEDIHQLLKTGLKLRRYISDNFDSGIQKMFAEYDSETDVILVKLNGERLNFSIASGKNRPSMACKGLFNVEIARPYPDEMMDSLMDEFSDDSASFEENLQSAENGDEDAMARVAQAYLNGDEVERDAEKAAHWFRKLAELDNSLGQFNLGILYIKGDGVEQSFEQAVQWLNKSAENGDDDAQSLAERCDNISVLEVKAKSGDTQAMADLANALMELGTHFNYDDSAGIFYSSLEWARKAEAADIPEAMWVLALAYDHGRGVEEDAKTAIEYYTRGAELGHADCQNSLGICYIQGKGVSEDQEKGFELCMKSANQGCALGMRSVGYCYQYGCGVDDDLALAVKWYEKSLEKYPDYALAQKVEAFKDIIEIED